MAKKKMSLEEYQTRRAELKILFDANDHDDDKVLELLEDEDGEVDENDFWIVRMILAQWQIRGE